MHWTHSAKFASVWPVPLSMQFPASMPSWHSPVYSCPNARFKDFASPTPDSSLSILALQPCASQWKCPISPNHPSDSCLICSTPLRRSECCVVFQSRSSKKIGRFLESHLSVFWDSYERARRWCRVWSGWTGLSHHLRFLQCQLSSTWCLNI